MRTLTLVLLLFAWGCDDGSGEVEVEGTDMEAGDAAVTEDAGSEDAGEEDATPPDAEADAALPPERPDCDPLDPGACAYPWPSPLYLEPDESRATGFTLSFGPTTLPQNSVGDHIDPGPYRRMDGYGLGVPIMALFPNLDLTPLPSEASLAESIEADSASLLLEVDEAGEMRRVPHWCELDSQEMDPLKRTLFLRAGEILKEDTHYIVAFRGLQDVDGEPIPRSEAFAALLDGSAEGHLATRGADFHATFEGLERQGVDLATLNLAWHFRTASSDGLHGRMLHMRDAGLEAVGESGPELTITEVETYLREDDGSGAAVHPHTALRIRGTMRVPHFMKRSPEVLGVSGWHFNLGEDGLPAQDGWVEAPIWINVPHAALEGRPMGLVNYGHGLFGDGKDVVDIGWTRPCGKWPPRPCGGHNSLIGDQNDLIFFATDMWGMSETDREELALTLLQDLSNFRWLADRLHQGLLNYLLIARAMRERLQDLPEIQERGIVIDPEQLYYSGISQGGIFGATYMALSTETTRGHLGVPGANYALLLHRSVDFEEFFAVLRAVYLDTRDQAISLAAIQLLWDGTDPISYYRRVAADPFPDTPAHQVIVSPAKGDWQVANVSVEVVARSGIEVPILGVYDEEREVPLAPTQAYPHTGSGVVLWDFENEWPAPGNSPPQDEAGDPHESAKQLDPHIEQMVHFFRTGEIIDVCAGEPCPAQADRVAGTGED